MLGYLELLGNLFHLGWRTLPLLPWAVVRRPGETAQQMARIFLGAFWLAVLGGAAVGFVIWLHGRGPLQAVGGRYAKDVLPSALSLVLCLELAPLVAGLIVAGRTGADLGAELGSMRQTEQIDALQVMGLDPIRELVAPRVAACMMSLPLLTGLVTFASLGAAFLADSAVGGMSWLQYRGAVLAPLVDRFADVMVSVLKTVFFGWLVGLTGCLHGLTAESSTEGVGRAATHGVVSSIFLVMTADVLLVLFFQAIL